VAKTSPPPPLIQTSFLSQFGDWFLEKKRKDKEKKKGIWGRIFPFQKRVINMSPDKKIKSVSELNLRGV
jgi:hypothetical protein